MNSPTAIRPTGDISGNAGQTGSLTTPPTCNPTTKINYARSPDPAVHPGSVNLAEAGDSLSTGTNRDILYLQLIRMIR